MRTNIEFLSNNIKIKGHLFIPDNFSGEAELAGVVVCHLAGGVRNKQQEDMRKNYLKKVL